MSNHETEGATPWPTNRAIAACLRVIAAQVENDPEAERFTTGIAADDAVEELSFGWPRFPGTEAGFRAWMNYYGGLSSEDIDAAVAAVLERDGSTRKFATTHT